MQFLAVNNATIYNTSNIPLNIYFIAYLTHKCIYALLLWCNMMKTISEKQPNAFSKIDMAVC